jgi:transcriptional regulator with XRE-family HTH domain
MMRFTEIGQQLRAFRLESGLRAEEIAARLGVSRAALYRYEKGDVIKLDTIQRLAELLKISPLSLLGIGTEYYSRSITYFERVRQLEESADQITSVGPPLCYLTTSDAFDTVLWDILTEAADASPDRAAQRAAAEQAMGILAARKRGYQMRRPNIVHIISTARLRAYLIGGVAPGIATSERVRRQCRVVASLEVEAAAQMMETEPMGLQFGLMDSEEPSCVFEMLRNRDRASVTVNPFAPDSLGALPSGVAMLTGADEAVTAHQRVAQALWSEALKGRAGATAVREILHRARAA